MGAGLRLELRASGHEPDMLTITLPCYISTESFLFSNQSQGIPEVTTPINTTNSDHKNYSLDLAAANFMDE